MTNLYNITIITSPFDNVVGDTILSNLIDLLKPLSKKLFLITGNFNTQNNKKLQIFNLKGFIRSKYRLFRILKYLAVQVLISINLLKLRNKNNIIIFYIGARTYIIPILLSTKVLKIKTIVAATGSISQQSEINTSKKLFGIGSFYSKLAGLIEKICFILSDKIAVESVNAINFLGLNQFSNKILINGTRYLDTSLFNEKKKYHERKNNIGYIGRLCKEKGVMNFVNAIPFVLNDREDVEFLIGGNGPLQEKIKELIKKNNITKKVKLTGWLKHSEVPEYLNNLKILVLPSYTEGLPGIVQEAMGCGTLVASTAVGGVPDLIVDGKSGFILENNTPQCIAKYILEILNNRNNYQIISRAKQDIKEYNYQSVLEKCERNLNKLFE